MIVLFQSAWRAPIAGLLYLLGWGLVGWVSWFLGYMMMRRATPTLLRARRFADWRWWGQLLFFVYTMLLLYVWTADGTLDVGNVGLQRIDLVLPTRSLALGIGGIAALIWLLWAGLLSLKVRQVERRTRASGLGLADLVISAFSHEASLAIIRGALIPLVGAYWGIWLAALCRSTIVLALPQGRDDLHRPLYREWFFLAWALDWSSSVLLFTSQSIWPGLALRVTTMLILRIALGFLMRLRFGDDAVTDDSVAQVG